MNTPLTVAKIVSLMAALPSGIEDPLALDKLHREQAELAAALAANDSEGVLTEVADVVYYAIKALVNGQLSEADDWWAVPLHHQGKAREMLDKETLAKLRQADYSYLPAMEQEDKEEKPKGEFERLVADIEQEITDAESWHVDEFANTLIIVQQESRDPSRSRNGGEYFYWKEYYADGMGVFVEETWSCDIAPRSQYGGTDDWYDCIISLDGLKRIAQLADSRFVETVKSWKPISDPKDNLKA